MGNGVGKLFAEDCPRKQSFNRKGRYGEKIKWALFCLRQVRLTGSRAPRVQIDMVRLEVAETG